jgi:tRNA dimethylallyltransferase
VPATDLALVGPTATGKTELATALWRQVPQAELVSVDAMAVYRGLDVGTETPHGSPAPWHLIDIAEPDADFSVAEFQCAARLALDGIHRRGHRAVLVGGTGLYHRAVVDDLELPGRFPEVVSLLEAELAASDHASWTAALYERLRQLDTLAASRIEPGNTRRIVRALEVTIGSGRPYSSFGPGLRHYAPTTVRMAGLSLEREEIDRRLEARLDRELAGGFVEEVATLAERPAGLSRTARQAIGYRELLAVVEDGLPLADGKVAILRRLRAFARRQEAWFRRDPRVVWFPADHPRLAAMVLDWWRSPLTPTSCETGPL